jgi:hypothetical protein
MRRISFNLTTSQIEDRSKDVTRRIGWLNAKVGERLQAVDRLRSKDWKLLAVIEIVSVRREPLNWITEADLLREGFATNHFFGAYGDDYPTSGYGVAGFVNMFCAQMKCAPADLVTRIEFRYVEDSELISHGVSLLKRALDEHPGVFNDLSRHQTKKAIAAGKTLAEELANA